MRPTNRSTKARAPYPRNSDKTLSRIAGFSAVSALFASSPERVERLFFDDRSKGKVGGFCAILAKARKPYRQAAAEELTRIAGTSMHGGMVAIARPRPVQAFNPDAARMWAADGKLLLLLDGVGNPHNLGAIVRTAAFFGLPRMVLSDHAQQALPSDASYRVSEGGFEYIDVYRAEGLAAQLRKLRGAYRVVGAAPNGRSAVPARRKSDLPFALVLGNEEHGLPQATLGACEEVVAIPGSGAIQSLNVAATGAILIHALGAAAG